MDILKQTPTLLLKLVILFIGALLFVFCVLTIPIAARSENIEYLPHFIGIYSTAIPFFFALYQGILLLNYIDKDKAFSDLSVKALKYIKYSAFTMCGIYLAIMPYIYYRADVDDAPGPLPITIVLFGASVIAATFAAVLQKLVQNGLDIKSENELTV